MKTYDIKSTGDSLRRKLLTSQTKNDQLCPLIALLVVMLATGAATAQGTVNFTMIASGVLNTRVYMPETNYPFWTKYGNTPGQIPPGTQSYSGALVTGGGFVAQLWAAPGANQPESALQPASAIRTFRTGSASGTVSTGVATLTNILPDTPVATVQVRVWESDHHGQPVPSWPGESGSSAYFGMRFGKSQPFNVEAVGGGTNPPPDLLNLRSFSLIQNLLDQAVKPLIYVQPQHQTTSTGGNATFTAETSCPANKPVYWRFNGSNVVSGWASLDPVTNTFAFPSLPGAGGTLIQLPSSDLFFGFPETNILQLTNVQASQAGIYSLVVTNLCCFFSSFQLPFALSSNAVLTVGTPGTLTATRDSLSQVVLNWDGVFFLQTATNVNGPFADLPGPIVFSPYTNSEANGSRFFRLRN